MNDMQDNKNEVNNVDNVGVDSANNVMMLAQVYPWNDNQRQFVQQLVHNPEEWCAGIQCHVNEAMVEQLEAQQIGVKVYRPVQLLAAGQVETRRWQPTSMLTPAEISASELIQEQLVQTSEMEDPKNDVTGVNYFIVWFNCPFTAETKALYKAIGNAVSVVELIEALGEDKYLFAIPRKYVEQFRLLPFVSFMRLYDRGDKGLSCKELSEQGMKDIATDVDAADANDFYAIGFHHSMKRLESAKLLVLQFLGKTHVKIVGQSKLAVYVKFPESGGSAWTVEKRTKLLEQVASFPDVDLVEYVR